MSRPKHPATSWSSPRKPIESLAHASDEDTALLGHLMRVCARVAQAEGLTKDGYRVVTNIGEHGGQSVPPSAPACPGRALPAVATGMSDYPDLLVLGAGPCGLAAAFHAKQSGLNVQLLDAGAQPGGRMRSSIEHLNGKELVIEHGPVGWAGPAPEAEAACAALGLEPIDSAAADSHRYLVHGDKLVPFPQSFAAMSTCKLLSVREKLRVASEKWADFAPEGKEETFHELFARRFGRRICQQDCRPRRAWTLCR